MLTCLPCQAHDILPRKNTYIAGDKKEMKQYYNKYIIIVSDTYSASRQYSKRSIRTEILDDDDDDDDNKFIHYPSIALTYNHTIKLHLTCL